MEISFCPPICIPMNVALLHTEITTSHVSHHSNLDLSFTSVPGQNDEWRMWKWKKGKRLANDFESRVESLQDLLLQKLLKKRKEKIRYNVCKWFPWGWEGQRCEDISSVNVWRKMDRKKGDFLLGFFFLKNSFFHHFLSVFVFLFFNFQIRRHGGDVIDNPSIRNLEEKSKNAD